MRKLALCIFSFIILFLMYGFVIFVAKINYNKVAITTGNLNAIEKLIQIEIPKIENSSLNIQNENRKEIQKNVAKRNTKGKPSAKDNKVSNRFSKSLATNQNEPTTSSEYKDEFQLPNFITKSFVERLSL